MEYEQHSEILTQNIPAIIFDRPLDMAYQALRALVSVAGSGGGLCAERKSQHCVQTHDGPYAVFRHPLDARKADSQ